MISKWLDSLEFKWAKYLPEVYDIFLGIIYWFVIVPIGFLLDILLFPIEIIILVIKNR